MSTRAERSAPGFSALLDPFATVEVEAHPGTVYGLWPDLRLAYVNPAWLEFARANGDPPSLAAPGCLGANLLDAVPRPLRAWFERFYGAALTAEAGELHPASHRYECSSADLFREFVLTAYPLGASEGLLVVNALVVEAPHDATRRPPLAPSDRAYQDPRGLVHQCAHCRKVEHLGVPGRWDWVPAWVTRPPPEVSHTVCPFCFARYFPET